MREIEALDEDAEAVYRAMLTHPEDGVAALAERLTIAETRVRSALDLLSALALVRPAGPAQGGLRPVSPDMAMDALLARQRAELAAQQQRLEATRAVAARLAAEYNTVRPYEADGEAEVVVGIEAIRERLALLTAKVRQEVMTFAPDGAQTEDNRTAARPLNQQLLDRGVRMRTVYLDSVRNSPPTLAHAEWLTARGGQVRTAPALPTRLVLIDRSTAVVPADPENTANAAVVLTGQGVVGALCALFDLVWQSARPLGQAAGPRDDDGLTGQEAVVLSMLADGLTDEAIAKRLGVSPRTARRLASNLMERLGARSRFQAGAAAVVRGWLPGGQAATPAAELRPPAGHAAIDRRGLIPAGLLRGGLPAGDARACGRCGCETAAVAAPDRGAPVWPRPPALRARGR
ncbi:LuxR C-terminal-related transcriptional regulator [Streptomyces xantholiticus]